MTTLQYQVVQSHNLIFFTSMVEKLLSEGWVPCPGFAPASSVDLYSQALIREVEL